LWSPLIGIGKTYLLITLNIEILPTPEREERVLSEEKRVGSWQGRKSGEGRLFG